MRKQSFTLIELLTVIAIIAILSGLLLPAVGRARATAQKTACASKMGELGKAEIMFSNENKNKTVPAQPSDKKYNFIYSLWDYVGENEKIFLCPLDPYEDNTEYKPLLADGSTPAIRFSYTVNGKDDYSKKGVHWSANAAKYTDMVKGWKSISTIKNPSGTLSLAEGCIPPNDTSAGKIYGGIAYATGGGYYSDFKKVADVVRHGNAANYLYMDGHVETLNEEEIEDQVDTNPSAWAIE